MNPLIVSAKVWHPCGAECLIQFNGQKAPFDGMVGFIKHLQGQGWLTKNPNAQAAAGTLFRVEAVKVSRRATIQNQQTVNIIDFYGTAPNMKHKEASVYLDRPERIEAFTRLSGLDPAKIPLNPGQAAIQQGTPAAADYIVPCRPMVVVTEPNPRYDPALAAASKVQGAAPYKTSPRQFVRFEAVGQPQNQQPQQNQPQGQRPVSPPPPPAGPVNGIINDPDFRKLVTAKGLTFQVAMQYIDQNDGTQYARSAKTVADVNPDNLRGFVAWLRTQPDKQQRPTPQPEQASYANQDADDTDDSGIPF